MGKLSDIAQRTRRQIGARKDSFLNKKKYLEIVFELDRQLSSLSRHRDRAFATLALEYINSKLSDTANEDCRISLMRSNGSRQREVGRIQLKRLHSQS